MPVFSFFLLVKATQNLDISAKVLDTKPNFTCGYDIWDNYNGASAMFSPYRVGTDCSNMINAEKKINMIEHDGTWKFYEQTIVSWEENDGQIELS